jgi:hypothetical protein
VNPFTSLDTSLCNWYNILHNLKSAVLISPLYSINVRWGRVAGSVNESQNVGPLLLLGVASLFHGAENPHRLPSSQHLQFSSRPDAHSSPGMEMILSPDVPGGNIHIHDGKEKWKAAIRIFFAILQISSDLAAIYSYCRHKHTAVKLTSRWASHCTGPLNVFRYLHTVSKDEKCIQNFVGKTWRGESTRKT